MRVSSALPTVCVTILLAVALLAALPAGARVWINEFMADNFSIIVDEAGQFEDWIELYNDASVPANVSGMYLTDTVDLPTRWRIPDGTVIPAKGYLLIWADSDVDQGPLHTNFGLSRLGETLALFDTDEEDNELIDQIVFGPQTRDISFGRLPDGGFVWQFFDQPSPGTSNGQPVPTETPAPGDADLNRDGDVDDRDLLLFMEQWHRPTPGP